jgi:hypothetical protein
MPDRGTQFTSHFW